MTDIYTAIREDHGKHRGLLGAIEETSGDSPERRRLWDTFYHEIKSHSAAEEETFYSKLMETPEGQDDARHSVSEHKEMDDLMEELNDTDMSSPAWLAKFKQLRHDYEHHMEEEEADIFSRAREVFSEKQTDAIGPKFLERKKAEWDLVEEKAEAKLVD